MYGTNTYTRLDVEYPSDSSSTSVKQPDANLSNYNTQLSRTVLHDENRYSDLQVRPKPTGRYEYVHEASVPVEDVTKPRYAEPETTYVERLPTKSETLGLSNREPLTSVVASKLYQQPASVVKEVITPHHVPTEHLVDQTVDTTAIQAEENRKAIEQTNHRKLVHETQTSIMAKKENYRKCKRRNRLFLFVFVIVLFLLLAVAHRMLTQNNKII